VTLTVALDASDEAASEHHRTVLATLPGRFRVASGLGTDVVLVSGDQSGWRERALDADGARAIMLTGTRTLTAAGIRDLAEGIGTPVFACPVYAADRAWSAALSRLTPEVADSVVLDSVSTAPWLRAALVDQLAVIRPLVGDPQDLKTVHASGDCYVLAGVVRGVTVSLAGAVSSAQRLDLDLVGTVRHWHAWLDADALASPARISVSDVDGERVLPPLYESSRRAAWTALDDALRGGSPFPYAADRLADDLAVAEATLGPGPGS